MLSSLAAAAVFLLAQIYVIKGCSFIKENGNFTASAKYEIILENEDTCLRACYDEYDCNFVEYLEGKCTVYKNGSESLLIGDNVFKFERNLKKPECSRSVQIEMAVEFEEITANQTANGECSTPPDLLTVIQEYRGDNQERFYADENRNFSTKLQKSSRMIFASKPQQQCTSIPVFTRAGHRRLYFGSRYNVTGYIFMEAYAFAARCVCSGACCGVEEIGEYRTAEDHFVYGRPSDATTLRPSDVRQTFYIAAVEAYES